CPRAFRPLVLKHVRGLRSQFRCDGKAGGPTILGFRVPGLPRPLAPATAPPVSPSPFVSNARTRRQFSGMPAGLGHRAPLQNSMWPLTLSRALGVATPLARRLAGANLANTPVPPTTHKLPSSSNARPIGMPREPPVEVRSEEHTSELQSRVDLVCRLLL